jgi:hypothetical protein
MAPLITKNTDDQVQFVTEKAQAAVVVVEG